VDRELAEIASRQHGVVARSQLKRALSEITIDRWIRTGRLHRIHPGVYAWGHDAITKQGRWMAAVLASGEGAVLSHASATALWGIWGSGAGETHVIVPGKTRSQRSIHRHFSMLPDDERTVLAGIPTTSAARAVLDLAAAKGEAAAESALREMEYLGIYGPVSLPTLLERYPRHRGTPIVRVSLERLADDPGGRIRTFRRWKRRRLRATSGPDLQSSVITYDPMAIIAPSAPPVGPRVRALREAMSLSLRDLADRSKVSAQMLSQVERGETSPTLAVAAKIAAGLELTLSQLLRLDEGQHVAISRAAERRSSRRGGHLIEELTPPLPGQRADVSLHVLDPGATTGGASDPPMHEPGSRETAIVLAGELALVLEGSRTELQEGDSVTFDADLPHHFENEGTEPTRFIAVIAAGLRRS
jgi:transcriptional regulator with XRE-family HTH domain